MSRNKNLQECCYNLYSRSNLGEFDVICARGRGPKDHTGNQRYRNIVQHHLSIYSDVSTKHEKSLVVSSIIRAVREFGGDFVRYNKTIGTYEKVSERIVREKVGQGLRDNLCVQYKSSTKAKKQRLFVQRMNQNDEMLQIVKSNKGVESVMAAAQKKVQEVIRCDQDFNNLFTAANMIILEECKRSRLVEKVTHNDNTI
eukprot:CAMPEP_0194220064 /NCGR_PEP_ID=MMETSP0156-20130528/27383_1 /TAXON_ID=33649 /ORGANISM="Thalassionema nitzschioides, Strain L26-B" /LENGTH=198 /DNA_ID=CAMNT_0038949939 /DNA_START=42 /DNA_END=638 /DNA_ORIENTATION=+